jgi:Icc-related predicted phosphoesterase
MKFVNAGKFYKANVIILGGDITAKRIIPILQRGSDYEALFEGKKWPASAKDVDELEKVIRSKGYYTFRTTPSEVEELTSDAQKRDKLFLELATSTLRRWMNIADERLKGTNIKCFVCPGNDDMLEIDQVIEEAESVANAGNKVVMIDNSHEMISLGWCNPTPWDTYKECSEEELNKRIDGLVSQLKNVSNSIFNMHAPPFGLGLDDAPKSDAATRNLCPVGSTAVGDSIKKYQPLLGLHGHIHEARGFVKIGRTTCINPGSSYDRGILLGALINVDEKCVKSFIPVTG